MRQDVAGKKIAVLSAGSGWHVQDLLRAGESLGIEVEPVDFRALRARITSTPRAGGGIAGDGLDLTRAEVVLVRTMPGGSLEQVIWRMDVLHALEARDIPVINPPRALETAIDKYLSLCRLQDAGVPVPETIVCETPERVGDAFDELGGDVVLKPLFGSEGKGLVRATSTTQLTEALRNAAADERVLYLQRFVSHDGVDRRVLVAGDEVLASMCREAPSGSWITNIAQGGTARPASINDDERDLALRASRAVGAEIAGVDLVRDADGRLLALEVNAVPGWRSLSAVCGQDIGVRVLRHVARQTRP